jgi:CelD/BcsL family acetyltransferase involved in cellulose biosynthesis
VVRPWAEKEFESASHLWADLLARSTADPLFMSWEWQWLWWKHHRNLRDAELLLLAGYDVDGALVGLAPFYLHRADHKGIGALRLESIGSNFRDVSPIFSEYLDLIIDKRYETSFLQAVGDIISCDSRWNDLVVANTPVGGHAEKLIQQHLKEQYVRTADPLVAYATEIPADFQSYLQSLDGETRRRAWNQRKKLDAPRLATVPHDRIDDALNLIDEFHQSRWGQHHFVGLRRLFAREFAQLMAARGALRMTELRSANMPLSLMYNVRLQGVEYNIQSGFDSSLGKGISPGYLHFGYALESACADGVRKFDFLAGKGLNRDYKKDFCTQPKALATLQSIRTKPLAWLYREYDRRFVRSIGILAPSAGLLADAWVYKRAVANIAEYAGLF